MLNFSTLQQTMDPTDPLHLLVNPTLFELSYGWPLCTILGAERLVSHAYIFKQSSSSAVPLRIPKTKD